MPPSRAGSSRGRPPRPSPLASLPWAPSLVWLREAPPSRRASPGSSASSGLGRQAPGLSLYSLTAPLSVQSPVSREENREDKATIKCETSPPSSPRTLRLEKLGHPALSQEEGRRYVPESADPRVAGPLPCLCRAESPQSRRPNRTPRLCLKDAPCVPARLLAPTPAPTYCEGSLRPGPQPVMVKVCFSPWLSSSVLWRIRAATRAAATAARTPCTRAPSARASSRPSAACSGRKKRAGSSS